MHLVTVGGLKIVVQSRKVLREGRELGFCDRNLRSTLSEMLD